MEIRSKPAFVVKGCPFCGLQVVAHQDRRGGWNKTFCSPEHKRLYWSGVYRAVRDANRQLRARQGKGEQ